MQVSARSSVAVLQSAFGLSAFLRMKLPAMWYPRSYGHATRCALPRRAAHQAAELTVLVVQEEGFSMPRC